MSITVNENIDKTVDILDEYGRVKYTVSNDENGLIADLTDRIIECENQIEEHEDKKDELDKISFCNFNLDAPKKILQNNEEEITDGMTGYEKQAYLLGVANTFSTIAQFLDQGNSRNSIQFYKKGKLEEFSWEQIVELVQ